MWGKLLIPFERIWVDIRTAFWWFGDSPSSMKAIIPPEAPENGCVKWRIPRKSELHRPWLQISKHKTKLKVLKAKNRSSVGLTGQCSRIDVYSVRSYLFILKFEALFKIFFFNVYLFLRQRETEHERGRVREREGDTESETGSRLSNSRTARSWPEPKSDAQPTEPPRRPWSLILNCMSCCSQMDIHVLFCLRNCISTKEACVVNCELSAVEPEIST